MRSSIVGSVVKPCSPPKKVSLDTNAPATPQKSKLADEFVSFLKIVSACSSCLEILSLHARNEGDQKPEDEAGSVEISFDIVDLDSIVQSAIAIVHGTDQAKGRKVSTDGFEEKIKLRADQRSLKQMLLNLLSNALKFSDPDRTVDLKSRHLPDGSFALTVIDHGIGMTAEEATIAVQPFQQIDSGLARRYDGTGLGLAIVKGLIERHGGRLTIESEPRVGSQISLIFPGNLVIAEGARLIAQAVN